MPFVEPRDIPGKPWGTETLLAHVEDAPKCVCGWHGKAHGGYTLKRLRYRAGHQGAFQSHVEKNEAFTLHDGEAVVTWVEDGEQVHRTMYPGMTFHVPPGTPHKFHAITDCVVYEASTPVFDDRVPYSEAEEDLAR